MTNYEEMNAIMEGEMIAAEDAYFAARNGASQAEVNCFQAGFKRAYELRKAASLKDLLQALSERLDTSSAAEIKEAVELIVRVQAMGGDERDCIRACFKKGPLFDGDVPSKRGRDSLLIDGFIVKVVVKGQDGFNACSHKGAWAWRLIEAGA